MRIGFIELDTVRVRNTGHYENVPARHWWNFSSQRWVHGEDVVEAVGKVLLPLTKVRSVRLSELSATIYFKNRDHVEISKDSYNKLREELMS